MVPNIETSKLRLAHLQDMHADLLRNMAVLARLRKQVARKEAALHAQVVARKQLRQMHLANAGDPSHVQHRAAG
jgi:hypothetical protein